MEDANDRLDILYAYNTALDNDGDIPEKYKDNKYYEEFENKRKLLFASITAQDSGSTNQSAVYQGSVDSISETMDEYNEKIEKLKKVKECIVERYNSFDSSDSYYYSIVSEYISSYDLLISQYDAKINEYQIEIDLLDSKIEVAKSIGEGDNISDSSKNIEAVQGDDENNQKEENSKLSVDDVKEGLNNNFYESDLTDITSMESNKQKYEASKKSIEEEKEKALVNLEETRVADIEQTIESYNNTLISLETNKDNAQIQKASVDSKVSSKEVAVLTEKQNIANEILKYEAKRDESESYLNCYNIENDNCIIKASTSGYFYSNQEYKIGSFLQEGVCLGNIYPEKESGFYAEIYVSNSDIGKIKEKQEVKFEIEAFPAKEYGFLYGKVESISKDITIDESSGVAYYIVKVKCNECNIKGGDGKKIELKNGMACQGRIIVGEKTVMTYILEKLNILEY